MSGNLILGVLATKANSECWSQLIKVCLLKTVKLYSRQKTPLCSKLSLLFLPFSLFAAIRPKRLLVYINPYGGKHQGKRIYEQKVVPIFRRASISTDVIGERPSAVSINIWIKNERSQSAKRYLWANSRNCQVFPRIWFCLQVYLSGRVMIMGAVIWEDSSRFFFPHIGCEIMTGILAAHNHI